jgi:hypothetical protein
MAELLTRFDYHLLDADTAQIVETRAQEIRGLIKRTAKNIIEIGAKLKEVKHLLPHGEFGQWLEIEFELAESTAQRFMRVAERFGFEFCGFRTLSSIGTINARLRERRSHRPC